MFRKVSLLILAGTLCIIVGSRDRRAAADDCPNLEVDEGIWCPVSIEDNPNNDCSIYNNEAMCNAARHAKLISKNFSATKFSTGNLVYPVFVGIPPQLLTGPCYTRVYCKWDDANKKCVLDKTELVDQIVYKTVPCAKGGGGS